MNLIEDFALSQWIERLKWFLPVGLNYWIKQFDNVNVGNSFCRFERVINFSDESNVRYLAE